VTEADRLQAGRLASWLFLLAGSITFLNSWLPVFASGNPAGVRITSGSAVLVGLITMRFPWGRWPLWASLLLVPVAMAIIGTFRVFGATDGYTFSVYFVIVFTWIGVAQPRWTSLWVAPGAAAVYLVSLMLAPQSTAANLASVTVAIPVCVLVAETIARTVQQMRDAKEGSRRQAAGLEALASAGPRLHAENDAHRVGELVAGTAGEVLGAGCVGVWLGTEASVLVPAGFHGFSDAPAEMGVSRQVAAAVLLSGKPGRLPPGGPFGDGLLVPLPGRAGPIGVLAAAGSELSEDFASHLAQLLAAQAGLRLEQLKVVETLTREAMQDHVTGLGNRRAAAQMLERVKPGDAIVLIDLDHFKNVNDTLGHAAGDEVLAALGRYLRHALRGGDSVARYGGEEFVAILHDIGPAAVQSAERLVERWRDTHPVTTFSAGVAVHEAGRSPAATLGRADAALYRAKQQGRDRALADDVVRS
jgi:diguanylate cyclase (GGDEF)-like protein